MPIIKTFVWKKGRKGGKCKIVRIKMKKVTFGQARKIRAEHRKR